MTQFENKSNQVHYLVKFTTDISLTIENWQWLKPSNPREPSRHYNTHTGNAYLTLIRKELRIVTGLLAGHCTLKVSPGPNGRFNMWPVLTGREN